MPAPSALPPALRKTRKPGPALPPPSRSGRLLVRLAPGRTALFRFLLEAYDNLAYFTVLERRTALLKLVFSPQRERAVRRALAEMARSLPFTAEDWPFETKEQEPGALFPSTAAAVRPADRPSGRKKALS